MKTLRKNRNSVEVNDINDRLALLTRNAKQNNYTGMAKKLKNVQRSS